jgi:hypothetical protein
MPNTRTQIKPSNIPKQRSKLLSGLSDEVDDDQVEDDVAEQEVGEAALRTDSAEVVLVRRINL